MGPFSALQRLPLALKIGVFRFYTIKPPARLDGSVECNSACHATCLPNCHLNNPSSSLLFEAHDETRLFAWIPAQREWRESRVKGGKHDVTKPKFQWENSAQKMKKRKLTTDNNSNRFHRWQPAASAATTENSSSSLVALL